MPDKDYQRVALIVSSLWRVTAAAKEMKIERTTLQTAVRMEQCRCYMTACGLPLVDLDDVNEWKTTSPGPGRPPKEKVVRKRTTKKRPEPKEE